MTVNPAVNYLINKNVLRAPRNIKKITVGSGGAQVIYLEDKGEKLILKTAKKENINENALYEGYEKELLFYKSVPPLPFIPKVLFAEKDEENGIIILMKYYEPIPHDKWDKTLLRKAAETIADLHSADPGLFNSFNFKRGKTVLDESFCKNSYEDWKFVLNQHKGKLNEKILDEIYRDLNLCCEILNKGPFIVGHGDCHPENFLLNGDELIICDWQNFSIGNMSGDINFFISRGRDFGIDIDENEFIAYYISRVSDRLNIAIAPDAIKYEKCAGEILTTFSFWAHYLHDAPTERVKGIYNSMVNSYKIIKA